MCAAISSKEDHRDHQSLPSLAMKPEIHTALEDEYTPEIITKFTSDGKLRT